MAPQDLCADFFEAYVGALEMESHTTGFEMKDWLDSLFSPEVFTNLTQLAERELSIVTSPKVDEDGSVKNNGSGTKRKDDGYGGEFEHVIDF